MKKKSLFFAFIALVAVHSVSAGNETSLGFGNASSSVAADVRNVGVGQTGELPDWISSMYPPYTVGDKVDPFVSFVKMREYESMLAAKQAKIERKRTTPLETVPVHSLKLIGIIEKPNHESIAMVVLPDGKGYFLRQGMTVGLYDGVVTSIGDGILKVDEQFTDVFNESKKRTITLRLRQEKE